MVRNTHAFLSEARGSNFDLETISLIEFVLKCYSVHPSKCRCSRLP